MYAPHAVTLYNRVQGTAPSTFEDIEELSITILEGVLVDASKGANARTSGLETADAVNLYIPFSVSAVDGRTGKEKTFCGPQEFWGLDDKSGFWTLSTDGNGGDSFFVKGVVVEDADVAIAHDDCYRVTKVDKKDFGSPDMQHWEVGGR